VAGLQSISVEIFQCDLFKWIQLFKTQFLSGGFCSKKLFKNEWKVFCRDASHASPGGQADSKGF